MNIILTIIQISILKKELTRSLEVQNIILCLLLNFEIGRFSQNVTKYLSHTGRKFWKLSEFFFTVLPTSEFTLIYTNISRKDSFNAILNVTSHVISSVPEW